ncbi:uncharacterized protein N7483_003609 [Penicillium malachiteum]|uniref:uncharacterized protein n=1 Tax=Penicillium malachiteum TaxID=1324776 RepID=UPI0025491130|nr:uncharacterized protein N7483_003609 [Penicillium malachiteum]KAJ5729101.1 hypothetical protein N7483_003609 [Penicillium malachiteum]
MHITQIFGICLVALASTTVARPHLAGPYHGQRIAIEVPTNSTQNATTTGTRATAPLSTASILAQPKSGTRIHVSHGLNSVQKATQGSNHCNELCSLESQTCTIAVPDDDKFCWQTYTRCIKKCRPDNFQK